jgi:predicted metal-dependent hydrolase
MLTPSRVIRSRRRTVSLEIQADATFVVRAPQRVSQAFIESFIAEKQKWLVGRLAEAARRQAEARRPLVEGGRFLYLGHEYELRLVEGGRTLKLDTAFRLPNRWADQPAAPFERWYRRQAKLVIPQRVAELATRHGLRYASVRVGGARTRWGSCSAARRLNFSWRLVMAPLPVVDYVVAHELAHLTHLNHSPAFWREVERLCSGHQTARRWLRDHGHRLGF